MKYKMIFEWIGKAFSAGVTAFIILTAFCFLYYNIPVHYPDKDMATDYKWETNAFYSRGTEGVAWGKTNNEGYINSFDYFPQMNINTLIMGSSHMEAYQVSINESTASRLNTLLKNKIVYNIGISGHTFLTCCCNMDAALNKYAPTDYLIVETSKIDFTMEELSSVINGTVPEISDNSGGILGLLSKNQFLRLSYSQIKGFMNRTEKNVSEIGVSDTSSAADPDTDQYKNTLNKLLGILSEKCRNSGCKLIIFYQPATKISDDGSLLLPNNNEIRALFSDKCKENGIVFLDMSDRFISEYETNHTLPHGFSNSSVGSGHLNKYGHEMIADELNKIIGD